MITFFISSGSSGIAKLITLLIKTMSRSFVVESIRLGTYTGTKPNLLSFIAPSQNSDTESSFFNPEIRDLILSIVWIGFLYRFTPSFISIILNGAPASFNLSLVVSIEFIPISQWINFLPKSLATFAVTPDPPKKSATIISWFEEAFIILSNNASGFCVE